eukprot:m.54487 g.54487  ORF g.54487 m.54487 type:complete len:598 (+) comp13255_c0_seq2:349-2142(+)
MDHTRHGSVGRNYDQYLRFKLTFGDEKRIVWLARPVTIEALRQEIFTLYKCTPKISYIDDEDDLIPISNQSELEHVIEVFSQSPQSNLKLHLFVDEQASPDSLSLASVATSTTTMRSRTLSTGSSYGSSFDPLSAHTPLPMELEGRPPLVRATSVGPARCHSPPPGFLNDHQRSQSSSSSFLNVNGGGEFIPENDDNTPVRRKDGPPTVSVLVEPRHRSTNSISSFSSGGTTSIESGFCDDKSSIDRSRADTFPRSRVGKPEEGGASTYPRKAGGRADDGFAALSEDISPRGSTATLAGRQNSSQLDLRGLSISAASQPAAGPIRHTRQPKRWQKGKLLGSGAYGQVFLALDLDTGAELAVKQVELHSDPTNLNLKEVQALEAEIELLTNLRHERIVTYFGTDKTTEFLTIFMEYVPGRSIHNRLLEYGQFSEDITRKYTRQLLEGLVYLHENRIVHRDIKGANVLVDAQGNVKLADFGASRRLQNIKTCTGFKSVHGTPYWMAPEVINGKGYGRKSDIWSLSCTVVEMLTTQPPFADLEPMAALFKIGQESTPIEEFLPTNVTPSVERFLRDCFQRETRPSAAELLNHPFITARST